jgi:hypothetical protein
VSQTNDTAVFHEIVPLVFPECFKPIVANAFIGLSQFSSTSRFTAGAAGFLTLRQWSTQPSGEFMEQKEAGKFKGMRREK